MNIPEGLLYAKSHEWLNPKDGSIGITDHAQEALGDLVFVNLPQTGDTVEAGDVLCDVESVKAVSDIYAPAAGAVSEVNEELIDHPELLNSDPYDSWIAKLEGAEPSADLLDAKGYAAFLETESED